MKKVCGLIMVMILMMGISSNFAYGIIDGDYTKIIYINKEEDLFEIADMVNSRMNNFLGYTICINTNLNILYYQPIGSFDFPFEGTIEGLNNRITIEIKELKKDNVGLVGCLGENGVIKNIKVSATIDGKNRVGAIVGQNKGVIANSKAEGWVFGKNSVGGIAGINEGLICFCENMAGIKGRVEVGGIAGCCEYSKAGTEIYSCKNYGKVYGCYNLGTICGVKTRAVIDECYNEGELYKKDVYPGIYYRRTENIKYTCIGTRSSRRHKDILKWAKFNV